MGDQLYRTVLLYAIGGLLVAGALGYCAGHAAGSRSAKLEQNAHRIRAASMHRVAAEKLRIQADERAVKAMAHRDSAKVRVVVVSDTTVRIDTLPPIAVPMPIVSLLRADDRALRMDSLRIDALIAENGTLREERDSWKERGELLEPHGWCGNKCHFLGGVLATVATAVVVDRVRAAGR